MREHSRREMIEKEVIKTYEFPHRHENSPRANLSLK